MKESSAEEIFKRAILEGCSDVHLKPGTTPKMRKNGRLIVIPGFQGYILTPKDTERLVAETMDTHALPRYSGDDVKQLDYSYNLPDGGGRFRMSAYKTKNADAVVGRLLAKKAKTLDELGVPQEVKRLSKSKAGLIIVSGATGSGKSTTMAGMIDYINSTEAMNIISIEDPIEVEHSDAMSSISQREVGVDVNSFEEALNASLRQDPDVILIGEIRTLEALKTAIRAADTGHLVITTLHTTDASKAINRILAMFPQDEQELARQQLASVLEGVIAQRLVPNLKNTRTVVNEILISTPEVRQTIINRGSEQDFRDIINRSQNMMSFEERFISLIELGLVDLKTAKSNSLNPEYFDTAEIRIPGGNKPVAPTAKTLPPIPGLSAKPLRTGVKPIVRPPGGVNPTDLLR